MAWNLTFSNSGKVEMYGDSSAKNYYYDNTY